MSYFKKVVAVPSLSKTGGQLDFGGLSQGNAWLALITFLYVDFFDTTGTLFSMANFVSLYVPGALFSLPCMFPAGIGPFLHAEAQIPPRGPGQHMAMHADQVHVQLNVCGSPAHLLPALLIMIGCALIYSGPVITVQH